MRRSVGLALVLAAVPFLSASAAPSAPPATLPAGGAAALKAALRSTDARLDALVATAKVDARLDVVRAYAAYSPGQRRDPRREVTVEKLLAIVVDGAASPEAREAAAKAMTSDGAKQEDPDLATDGRGIRRARAAFSMKVASYLTDDDVMTRGLAKRILEAYWPQANEIGILQYSPRYEKTWKSGKKAWQEHLRK